jgi:hypothetical protein
MKGGYSNNASKRTEPPMPQPTKKPGRPKGATNKTSKDFREIFKKIYFNELQHVPELLDELSDKQQLDFVLKVAPYMMPRLNSVDILDIEPPTEEDKWRTLIMDYGDRVETKRIPVDPYRNRGRHRSRYFP